MLFNHDASMTNSMKTKTLLALAAALAFGAGTARAELLEFYVGVDGLPTLASGTYRGLANPNHGRITFLYAHSYPEAPFDNHYHSIGVYTYTGPTNAPVVVPTNANFRIPEASTGQLPLTLVAATNGLHAGKLVNRRTAEHYSDPRIRSVHRILPHVTATATNEFGYGSGEYIMFRSSAGRWTNTLAGAALAMELVEKAPELKVGTEAQLEALVNPGDRVAIGEGNRFEFVPVVWAEPGTPAGTYALRFKLVDTRGGAGALLDSGIVTFWYRVLDAPELAIANSVTLVMPLVTEGHVLEEADSVDGPWTAVAASPVPETVGGGHSAAQTGRKTLTQPTGTGMKVYRLRKL